jgi:hypothetical protein
VSPEPYVRGQAYVLGALLVAAAVFSTAEAALACAIVSGAVALILNLKYQADLRAVEVEGVPPHRERLDLIVAGDLRAALLAAVTASALMIGLPVDFPVSPVPPGTAILLMIAAAGVLLSSLFDWYVILPRVSGLLGVRPCRQPNGRFPRFPKTWRETTRWWYIHRIAAALLLRFGISYAVVLAVNHHTSIPGGAGVVGGAAAAGFASYLAAVPKAIWEAGHPSLILGRTVHRRNVERVPRVLHLFGLRLELPVFKRRIVGPLRPREYVYDVSLEAVQLAFAQRREEEEVPRDEDEEIEYESDPNKLKVRDIDASQPEPAKERFHGCHGRCSGISWYCIENPNCFATK